MVVTERLTHKPRQIREVKRCVDIKDKRKKGLGKHNL